MMNLQNKKADLEDTATQRRLVGIVTYPVKGFAAVEQSSAYVLPAGLKGDRRWLVTTKDGVFLTQRDVPQLVKLNAKAVSGGIEVTHEDASQLFVACPPKSRRCQEVQIWKDHVRAQVADGHASQWLSIALGRDVQLVYMQNDTLRPIDPEYSHPGEHVSFADGYPVMVATTASLLDLENRLGQRFDMKRFRPNVIVKNDVPWEEDAWKEIEIGSVRFRVAKPCRRCVVTTLDPKTGQTIAGNEPLATLGKFHRDKTGGIIFGQNLVPLTTGHIAVGDRVKIIATGRSNLE